MPIIPKDLTNAYICIYIYIYIYIYIQIRLKEFDSHHRFDLKNRISQFAIHLRELAIRKNLKTNKIAIQKKLWGKANLRIKIIANVKT